MHSKGSEAATGKVAPAACDSHVTTGRKRGRCAQGHREARQLGLGLGSEWTTEPLVVEAATVRSESKSPQEPLGREPPGGCSVEVLRLSLGLWREPSSHSQHQQEWREQHP